MTVNPYIPFALSMLSLGASILLIRYSFRLRQEFDNRVGEIYTKGYLAGHEAGVEEGRRQALRGGEVVPAREPGTLFFDVKPIPAYDGPSTPPSGGSDAAIRYR